MMKSFGFGALLADDMGLGKTVQILALLSHMRTRADFKALLITPASLLGNWAAEIQKFAPTIKNQVLHGKYCTLNIEDAELFITTYGMALRIEALKKHNGAQSSLTKPKPSKIPQPSKLVPSRKFQGLLESQWQARP